MGPFLFLLSMGRQKNKTSDPGTVFWTVVDKKAYHKVLDSGEGISCLWILPSYYYGPSWHCDLLSLKIVRLKAWHFDLMYFQGDCHLLLIKKDAKSSVACGTR